MIGEIDVMKDSDVYYLSKSEVVLGFRASKGFAMWLGNVVKKFGLKNIVSICMT